ncbi:hypothetical protein POL68_09730 [Stigmatella sp. ncwal1]|uniref:Uncharacterized protein n=1 Tax=Stigmatella ashevillensis TaxID=2995309 RepID=A0ABT5D503_9BACT|nr:hypothetical protein [Stigmatella ashevillena]MDC0708746.1 hypothetical protein [Stigmatella ashevillena]
MKKIIHNIRSCRLFRPMTFEEAKRLCTGLSKSMMREHEGTMNAPLDRNDDRAVALHLVQMTKRTRRLRLSRSSLLLHFRLLVGNKQEQEDIIAGCFDANFELMFKPQQDDGQLPPAD